MEKKESKLTRPTYYHIQQHVLLIIKAILSGREITCFLCRDFFFAAAVVVYKCDLTLISQIIIIVLGLSIYSYSKEEEKETEAKKK